ncbi:MAG: hypothetical protein KIT83_02775 [Bryobacterales bacterium]|nr:hypothetical protein [Bryobacterales bacterium]
MTPSPALIAAFTHRLPAVEPLRRRARNTVGLQVAGYVVLVGCFLLLLAGVPVGTMWFLGNFVTQNLAVVFGTALVVAVGVVSLAVFSFKRFSRWRGDSQAQYVEAFRNQVVIPTLRDLAPRLHASADGLISSETFKASKLFSPRHDRFAAAYGFVGEMGGVRYSGSTIRAWKYVADVRHERREDATYFKGVFFHINRPVEWPGTVRLVDREGYESGAGGDLSVVRHGNTVRVSSRLEAFDPEAALVIDEAVETPPAIPEQVFHTWVELRKLLSQPLYISFNATGVYLALSTPASQRWPLEDRLHVQNNPEELAADAELLQRVLRAVELLRLLFP